jgi:hypothetical protein
MDNTTLPLLYKDDIKENTKTKTSSYNKTFFEQNKDKKYHCELCNSNVSIFNKSHHKNSKKHKMLSEKESYIKSLEEKDKYVKILEEKDAYIKLLEEKELYIKKLKEREELIKEFELKHHNIQDRK